MRAWLDELGRRLPAGLSRELSDDAEREVVAMGGGRSLAPRELDETWQRHTGSLARYQIHRGTVYRVTPGARPRTDWLAGDEADFAEALRRLVALVPSGVRVPDLDLLVNLGDDPIRPAPVFSRWVREGDGNARLPATIHRETDLRVGLDDRRIRAHRKFDAGALTRAWEDRERRVVWRGTATGMYDGHFRWSALKRRFGVPLGRGIPRIDLCRMAARHPDVIDAAMTGWQQVSPQLGRTLRAEVRTTEKVPRSWYLAHQYVINVDGNVATSSFLTFLGSGTAVLKQDSPFTDWCAGHLVRGEHYVPVRRDLKDLVSVARDCLAHPERGRAVAEASRRFAERYLTGAAVDFYLLALLDRYALRSPSVPAPHPEATRV